MHRRCFLKFLGKGLLTTCGLTVCSFPAWSKSAFDYALEGQDLIQQQQYAKAVEALRTAIRMDPASDWYHGLMGRACRGLGKTAESVAAFREAVRLNSEDTYSRMMIEMMTQKPLPRLQKEKKPLSDLEVKALEEEKRMMMQLKGSQGLGYQVKRVVIDAGHGGFDPGAVGRSGLKEKDVALDIAIKLNERLNRGGRIKSFLTRTGDYYIPLSARTVSANQYRADLFISLHINANEKSSPHGSETYYCSETASSNEAAKLACYENSVLRYDEPHKKKEGHIDIEEILFNFEQSYYWNESGRFARIFQERFKQGLPFQSRGVHSANFYVLRKARMPAILLETGFISNPDNEARLQQETTRMDIVEAILRGLS